MRTRIVVAVSFLILGSVAPLSSATASLYPDRVERHAPAPSYEDYRAQPLGAHDHPRFTGCPMSSASEGNANQQNFPVKQYGQTSGGNLC